MEGTEAVVEVTESTIFEKAGEVLAGFMKLVGEFFSGLWAVPMGRIIIVLGIISAAIGLCYRLFLRKKHI